MKGVRMQKAQAMGTPAKLGKGAGNTYKSGNAGQGAIPGPTKSIPSTMPKSSAFKTPKGTK